VRKYIYFAVVIGFFIFLQSSSLYSFMELRGVSPDFLLVSLCISAFFLGPMAGEIIGFAAGFAVDILAGGLLGISAFTYTLIGFGAGIAGQKVYSTSILVPVILMFIVTLVKASVLGMLAALFLKPGYFGYFTHGRVFLEVVFNCVVSPIFFFLIARIERNVSAEHAVHFYRYRQ
jgi:rod shape-determining protein MreD